MTLALLKPGQRALIIKFEGDASSEALSTRMMEMGLTVGSEIEVVHEAPFGGAIAVRCRGSLIALRLTDARIVKVSVTA